MRLKKVLTVFVVVLLWASIAWATVSTTYLKSGPYNTDAVTIVFSVTFQYVADTDLTASIVNISTGSITNLVQNTDYVVTDGTALSDGTFTGGTITIQPNAASGIANGAGQFPTGYTLTISRNAPLTQQQSYPSNGIFPSAATEQALDRITLFTQQQQLQINSAIQIPQTDNGINVTLPSASARASRYLSFDSSGNVTTSPGTIGGVVTLAASSPLVVSSSTGNVTVSIGTSTPVPASLGGTGQTSLTATNLLIGNGTSSVNFLAPVNGQCVLGSGGAWTAGSCSGTSMLTLGTSASATNPQRSADATTGFYSAATSVVAVAAAGKEIEQWNTLANATSYLSVTAGTSGLNPTVAVAGSDTNEGLALTMKGSGSLVVTGSESVSGNFGVTGIPTLAGIVYPTSASADQALIATTSALVTPETLPNCTDSAGQHINYTTSTHAFSCGTTTSSSGSMVLLNTVNASGSASLSFGSTYINSGYNKYVVEFDGVYFSGGTPEFDITVSSNNGSSYLSSGYEANGFLLNSSGVAGKTNGAQSKMKLIFDGVASTSSTNAGHGTIKFSNPSNSGVTEFTWEIVTQSGISYRGFGDVGATSINNIKIFDNNGSNVTGNFHLYGLGGN